ncbi:hypothetical protein HK099_000832, partial [Clydaea vesicula]
SNHPNQAIRSEAEELLKNAEKEDGFLTLLMQLVGMPETDPAIKTARWESLDKSKTLVGPQDRAFIKANILNAIVHVDAKLRILFAACLNNILATEYPQDWPEFLPTVKTIIQSDDTNVVHAGLSILWEVISLYRFKAAEKRAPLHHIVSETFSTLLLISQKLLPRSEPQAGAMMHKILKTYYASIEYELSFIQQNSDSLIPWGNLFIQMIEKEIPVDLTPSDIAEREKFSWWKAKKWAYHSIYHLFVKYCVQPQSTKKSVYTEFSKNFITNFVPTIVQCYLKQVKLLIAGTWMSNRTKQQLSLLLTDCIKQKNTWLMIKPDLEPIVVSYIFPQLCVTDVDLEEWENDPVEYIQRKLDPMEDCRSSVAAAQGLLSSLVKYHFKQTFMSIINFVNGILQSYNSTPIEQRNPKQKDGAIHLVSCLARDILGKKSPIKDQIESFLATNVLPELRSSHPYLRVRACDVLIKFETAMVSREGDLIKGRENVQFIFDSLLACLQDSDLPVRVWGALTLRDFLQYESIREGLKPHVPGIMQVLLNLTNEIDMDTLSQTMESIAATYPEQLAPFAVQLGGQLRDSYLRIVGDINIDDDTDEALDEQADKTMAAIGIMKTISTLVISLDSSPQILQELELAVGPVVYTTLQNGILDLYDDAFEIIDAFTFCMKSVSPTMWSFFPLIHKAFKTDAFDYLEEMLPSLDNYLSFGKNVIIHNKEYQMMAFDIAQSTFKYKDAGEADYIRACQLFESMLLNLQGYIDEFIPQILETALQHLNNIADFKTTSFKVHCLEVVINSLYYSPLMTLSYLEQKGVTLVIFQTWFKELESFKRVHDKKLSILTICKIISYKYENLPQSIQSIWGMILDGALRLFSDYPAAVETRKKTAKMYEGGDSEGDYEEEIYEEEYENEDDEEDNGVGEDEKYVEFLHNAAEAAKIKEEEEQDNYESDDEWGVVGLEEDPFFVSVLDQIDPYIAFQDTLSAISAEMQHSLVQGLNEQQKILLNEVMMEANKIRSNPNPTESIIPN